MPCTPFRMPTGESGFMCTRGGREAPCSVPGCGRPHKRLCDWEIGPGATCDARLCDEHATKIAPDRDLCPTHAKLHAIASGNVGELAAAALLGAPGVNLARKAEGLKLAIEERRQLAIATGTSPADFDRLLAECRAEAERSVYEVDMVALLTRRMSEPGR